MTRVKGATNAIKNRRKTLKRAKGFRFGRSTKERQANEALAHAGAYAFAHRRDKKGVFRRLWNVRISALLKKEGLSYSKFIGLLKKADIALDRKILSELAEKNPEVLKGVVQHVQQGEKQA